MPTPSEMYDEGWHQGHTHALATMADLIQNEATKLRNSYRNGNTDIAYIHGIEWASALLDEALHRAEAEYDRSRSRTPDEAVPGDAPADQGDPRPGGLLAG